MYIDLVTKSNVLQHSIKRLGGHRFYDFLLKITPSRSELYQSVYTTVIQDRVNSIEVNYFI